MTSTENNDKITIKESLISFEFSKLTLWQKIRLGFSAFIGLLVIIVFIQNFKEVSIEFLWWSISLSISLLVLICVAIGALIVYIRESRRHWKKNRQIDHLERRIKDLS